MPVVAGKKYSYTAKGKKAAAAARKKIRMRKRGALLDSTKGRMHQRGTPGAKSKYNKTEKTSMT
jgi:hypothetical protein